MRRATRDAGELHEFRRQLRWTALGPRARMRVRDILSSPRAARGTIASVGWTGVPTPPDAFHPDAHHRDLG